MGVVADKVQPLSSDTTAPTEPLPSLFADLLIRLPMILQASLDQQSWKEASKDCAILSNRPTLPSLWEPTTLPMASRASTTTIRSSLFSPRSTKSVRFLLLPSQSPLNKQLSMVVHLT